MEPIKKEVLYAKETGELMTLLIELVKDLKAKKDVSALAAENLPLLIAAMDGMDKIPEEAKDKHVMLSTVGMHVGELAAVFLG